jgi:hypothetical protein
MITHVCGKPRRGKTSLVVAMILNEYMKYNNTNYKKACEYIKNQNKNGAERTLPPQRHVVSANFNIYKRFPTLSSYPISGWEFGCPNPYIYTKPLIPYGIYAFDEAQRYFDSKGDQRLPPWVTQAFELHGHIFLTMFLITQRYIRLNADIRDIVDRFIYVEKSVHTYIVDGHKVKSEKFLPYGRLIKTVWYGREFEDGDQIEDYVKKNAKVGKAFKYEFEGDIKSHYNPYAYAVEMENLNNDFNYYDFELTERPKEWSNYKKKLEPKKQEEMKNGQAE